MADDSLEAAARYGPETVSAAASGSDGQAGSIAVDTTNKLIRVKVTDSGTDRWWKVAALVSP
jgi:hypothetical protein